MALRSRQSAVAPDPTVGKNASLAVTRSVRPEFAVLVIGGDRKRKPNQRPEKRRTRAGLPGRSDGVEGIRHGRSFGVTAATADQAFRADSCRCQAATLALLDELNRPIAPESWASLLGAGPVPRVWLVVATDADTHFMNAPSVPGWVSLRRTTLSPSHLRVSALTSGPAPQAMRVARPLRRKFSTDCRHSSVSSPRR